MFDSFDPDNRATWTDDDWAAAFAFCDDGGDPAVFEPVEVAA